MNTNLNSPLKQYLRKTTSVCPQCHQNINAEIICEENGIFLKKTCTEHGDFSVCLSKTPQLYSNLENYYFLLMTEQQPHCDYEIWTTLNCNMNCPICFFDNPPKGLAIHEPTLEAIENFAKKDKHSFYCLTGAESTFRDDLVDIIRILKKYKKGVTLNTNGIKLVNESYLLELKNAGLDRVILQFDGFDPEVSNAFRGNDISEERKKILSNLQENQIPTGLNATIAGNLN